MGPPLPDGRPRRDGRGRRAAPRSRVRRPGPRRRPPGRDRHPLGPARIPGERPATTRAHRARGPSGDGPGSRRSRSTRASRRTRSTGAIVTPIFQTSTFAQTCRRRAPRLRVQPDRQPDAAPRSRPAWPRSRAPPHGLAFASGLAAEDAVLRMLRPRRPPRASPTTPTAARTASSPRSTPAAGIEYTPVAPRRPRPAQRRLGDRRPGWCGSRRRPTRCCDHRHRRRRRARPPARARWWSWTTPSPRPTCSSPWRSAPTWSCTRRRSTSAATATSSAASSPPPTASSPTQLALPPERCRGGSRAVRLLPGAAGRQDPAGSHGPPLRQRRRRSPPFLVTHPAVERVLYPGLPAPSWARTRRPADAGVRGHGVFHAPRR